MAQRKSFEGWSPTLFLAAGGLLLVYASLNGLWAFGNVATRQNGLQFGYVFGFLGLLGLYPSLADRSPWLARSGAAGAVFGIMGISAITATELSQLAGLTSRPPPAWTLILLLALVGFVLGYLSYGVAVLRTGLYSKAIGIGLLVPGVIVVLMFVHIAAGYASDVTAFVISAGEAMAHLAIGASLRTKSARTERATRTGDAEVKAQTDD